MAGFFGKIKNTGLKAKLQGECAMLDRELKARKMKFGVELYDLLEQQETGGKGGIGGVVKVKAPAPGSFKSRIKEHWELVSADILALRQKQDALKVEKTHEEVRRERGAPAVSAKEKLASAGNWMSSQGMETKLAAQIALVDRDILKRKQQFGIDVYDDAIAVVGKDVKTSLKTGMKNAMRAGLTKVSETEQKIQTCVEFAAKDCGTLERSKQTRLREIDDLKEEGAFGGGGNTRAEI